jgi:hypothetical protein
VQQTNSIYSVNMDILNQMPEELGNIPNMKKKANSVPASLSLSDIPDQDKKLCTMVKSDVLLIINEINKKIAICETQSDNEKNSLRTVESNSAGFKEPSEGNGSSDNKNILSAHNANSLAILFNSLTAQKRRIFKGGFTNRCTKKRGTFTCNNDISLERYLAVPGTTKCPSCK